MINHFQPPAVQECLDLNRLLRGQRGRRGDGGGASESASDGRDDAVEQIFICLERVFVHARACVSARVASSALFCDVTLLTSADVKGFQRRVEGEKGCIRRKRARPSRVCVCVGGGGVAAGEKEKICNLLTAHRCLLL